MGPCLKIGTILQEGSVCNVRPFRSSETALSLHFDDETECSAIGKFCDTLLLPWAWQQERMLSFLS